MHYPEKKTYFTLNNTLSFTTKKYITLDDRFGEVNTSYLTMEGGAVGGLGQCNQPRTSPAVVVVRYTRLPHSFASGFSGFACDFSRHLASHMLSKKESPSFRDFNFFPKITLFLNMKLHFFRLELFPYYFSKQGSIYPTKTSYL